MNDDERPARSSRGRLGWRWLRRGVLMLVAVLLVVVVFHRPLAHWAIGVFGARWAEKAGMEAAWTSTGSVWNDLALNGVHLKGGEGSVIRSLTAERVAVEYDFRRWQRSGPGAVVRKLAIRHLEAEVDLSRGGASSAREGESRGTGGWRWGALEIPVVEIERLSLRLKLPGGQVEVVDFWMTIDPEHPGKIRVERVSVPGLRELVGAEGTTRATQDSLVFEDVRLWTGVEIDRLVVSLAELSAGRLGLELAARQEEASAEASGTVTIGAASGPLIEAKAVVRQASPRTLAFWGAPEGRLDWDGGEWQIQANGPVMRPDLLEAGLTVSGATLAMEGRASSTLNGAAELRGGTLTVSEARWEDAAGKVTAQGKAVMPRQWSGVVDTLGDVDVEFDVARPEEWLPETVGLRGRLAGRAQATFAQRSLTGAAGNVQGSSLVFQGLPVQDVTARLTTTNGSRLQVEAEARLNATNRIDATGWLDLQGDQSFEAAWKADCRDLDTIPVEARAGLPWPTAGTLISNGTVAGSVAAVRGRDWPRLTGTMDVNAASLKIREAALESLRLRARTNESGLEVEEMDVRFDAQNRLSGAGRMEWSATPAPLTAQVRLSAPEVARLSGWSTSFGGPALRGGSVEVEGAVRGAAGSREVVGNARVKASGLQIDGMPAGMGLDAEGSHDGKVLTLSKVSATAGGWRAEGTARWDGSRLELPALGVWSQSQQVAELVASLPLTQLRSVGADPPVLPEEPVSLNLKVSSLDLDRLGKDLGRPLPVRGTMRADAAFSGGWRTLAGTLTAEANELRPAVARPGAWQPAAVRLNALLRDGQVRAEGRASQPPFQPLSLDLQAPADLPTLLNRPDSWRDIPLKGQLRLPQTSMAFLAGWIPNVVAVSGTAAGDATVSGTAGLPRWQGQVRMDLPEIRLAGPAAPTVRDVVLRMRADEKRIEVSQASVMVAGGRLRVTGGADVSQLADPQLDLRLRADEVLVIRDEAVSMRANADIACRGPLSAAAVTGSVDLVRGRVFKEIEFLPLSLPNQLPPPPPPTALARSGPPALPPPFDAWTFDVAVRTRDPVRLLGNVVRGTVAADLRLGGTGGRPVLTGRATAGQMWVRLPFSRLNITEGALVFTEDQPFDPQIQVKGESITEGRVINVALDGRALAPKVRMTSSPPLPESDIASILATGVTAGDLASHGQEAAGRAAFVLLQQAYRRMFPGLARGRLDAEPPRFSLEFAWFGSDPTRRSLSAIYELSPEWRVIGRVGEVGTFRGLLHYLIRFR